MAKAYDITTLSPDIQNQIKSSMRNIGDEFRLPSGESIVKVSDTGYMTGSGEMNTPIGKVFFNTEPIPVRSARDTADLQRGQQNELQKQALERELARIETETQNRINEQTKLGEENLAKTRGINIRSGLSGSPFAESLKGEVKALTASAVASERTKGTELRARATGTFNENIQKIEENYNARMALIQENEKSLFKEKSDLLKEEKTQALGDFDLLAKSGSVDFDKLKEQGLLEGYSKQTGKSAGELELRFNAQLPKTEASDFRWGKNGEAYQYNKMTGEFLRRPDLDEGGGTGFEGKVQMLGDQIFIIPDKFTYDPTNPKSQADQLKDQMIPYGKTGEFKASTETTQPGENPQLYSGLTSKTATAVRSQVSAYKTEPAIQNFVVVQEGRNFASSISDTTKNPADDQALIYSLAKALDPGSVVREGEYATAQKYAQSWIKAYGTGVEQALLGTGFLSKEARKNIKKTIEQKYKSSERTYDNLYKQYSEGIDSLTGRNDGEKFLKDYKVSNQISGNDELFEGEIKVMDIKTGQIGAIPEDEFDPAIYERQ